MTYLIRGAGLLPLLLLLALSAHALVSPTYTVNSDAYTPDVAINTVCADSLGRCTLRAALDECFAVSYVNLSLCTINLDAYHVVIDSTIEVPYGHRIYFQCSNSASIDANNAVRAFKLSESSDVTFDSCNVVNGHVCDDDDNDNGGAFVLHQQARLTLQSSNVTHSHACGAGGAIALNGYMSQVNVNGGEVAYSTSGSYAGGIHMFGDAALFVYGGAQIHHNERNGISATDGFVDISGVGTTIHSNGELDEEMASGIYIGTDPGSEYTALYLGNGTVIRNNSGVQGGGVFIDSSWWDSAPYQDNVLVEMSGLVTIEDNSAAWIGGGMLLFLHLGDTVYTSSYATVHYRNNTAFLGGGLFVDAHYSEGEGGHLHVRDSVFENNVAIAEGGGTFLWTVNGSTIHVDRSLFSNNTAHVCGGASIFTPSGSGYSPVSYVSRSTFSNNTALDSSGGALCLHHNDWWYFMSPPEDSTFPTFDINFNTIVYNRAAVRGGGIALSPYYDDDEGDVVPFVEYTLIFDSNVVVANRAIEYQNTSDIDFRAIAGANTSSHGHNFACYVNLLQPFDATDHFTPALCADGIQTLVMPHLQDVGARFRSIMRAHPPTPCSPILNAGNNDNSYWYSYDQRRGHPRYTNEGQTDAGAITSSDAHACLACHPLCPLQCVRYEGESTTTCVVTAPDDGTISGSDSVNTLRECIAYCRGVAGISAAQCTIVLPRFFPPQNYTIEAHDVDREPALCHGQLTVSGGNTRIVPYDNRYADFPVPVANPLTTHGLMECDADDDDDGSVCDDNIACTYDYCRDGDDDDDQCVHEPNHGECDDGNEYTQDICHIGRGCVHVWIDNNETAAPSVVLTPTPGQPLFHITNGSFTTLGSQDVVIANGIGVCGQNGGAVQVTNFALGLFLRVVFHTNLLPTAGGCPPNLKYSRGGAIYVNNGQLQMQQVSCYGNEASYGGCLYVSGQSVVTIRRSTLARNEAAIRDGGGGIRAMDGGGASRVISSGSLYSKNVHGDLSLGHGVYASQGYNMYDSSGKGVKRIQGLAELDIAKANTTTVACPGMCPHLCVPTTSPAVNRLKGPFCAAINTDACGVAQIGPFCDIGAGEVA